MTVRWATYTPTFMLIAREHLDELEELENILHQVGMDLSTTTDDDIRSQLINNFLQLEVKIEQRALIAITFSAMTLEAYIYDYAVRRLSKKLAEYVDKLDVIGKWIIIPRLITGKEIPRGERAFQLLQELIRDRNKIVHHKPNIFSGEDSDFQKQLAAANRKRVQLRDEARNAVKTLDLLADAILEIDPTELTAFMFLKKLGSIPKTP